MSFLLPIKLSDPAFWFRGKNKTVGLVFFLFFQVKLWAFSLCCLRFYFPFHFVHWHVHQTFLDMKIWTLHPVQRWSVFQNRSPVVPLGIHHVPQTPPGLSFLIWMFQCNHCFPSGSSPTPHPPALSATGRIANRFRSCSLKGWIWHICKELGLVPTGYHPFPLPCSLWCMEGTLLPEKLQLAAWIPCLSR